MDKFLYISTEVKEDANILTVIKSFNTVEELTSFIEIIEFVLHPFHKLSYRSNSTVFYKYDPNYFIDTLIKRDIPLTEWYSMHDLDKRTQIYYSIYTKEKFERSKQNLLQHKI